jgi:hypothetical protein
MASRSSVSLFVGAAAAVTGVCLGATNGKPTMTSEPMGSGAPFAAKPLGFPGYWVHRIIVDDTVPVELMSFEVH